MEQIAFFREKEFPEDARVYRACRDAGIGLYTPAKIGTLPWTQPVSAQGIASEPEWSEKLLHEMCGSRTSLPERRKLQIRELGCHFSSGLFGFAENISDAANLCADAAQFLFDTLVATIDVIHAIDNSFALGDQCR